MKKNIRDVEISQIYSELDELKDTVENLAISHLKNMRRLEKVEEYSSNSLSEQDYSDLWWGLYILFTTIYLISHIVGILP